MREVLCLLASQGSCQGQLPAFMPSWGSTASPQQVTKSIMNVAGLKISHLIYYPYAVFLRSEHSWSLGSLERQQNIIL